MRENMQPTDATMRRVMPPYVLLRPPTMPVFLLLEMKTTPFHLLLPACWCTEPPFRYARIEPAGREYASPLYDRRRHATLPYAMFGEHRFRCYAAARQQTHAVFIFDIAPPKTMQH